MIKANKPCEDVRNLLRPIKFKLEKTLIEINPLGYTYMMDKDQGYCQIGIESLEGVKNEYRLGSIFLRNFYTGLDFDNDQIIMGVNMGMEERARAWIDGHVYNPYKPRYMIFKFVLVFFFILILGSMVAFYIHRVKELKEEQEALAKRTDNARLAMSSSINDYKYQV